MVELKFHSQVVALMAKLLDVDCDSNYVEERKEVKDAVSSRRAEFFAGRNLARQALAKLNVTPQPLPRNPDRSPRWPAGVKGSISHTSEWLLVAVTASSEVLAIGVDLEPAQSVSADLRAIVRTSACDQAFDDTVVFSAKESVFKAVSPLCQEFLEFSDVAIKRGPKTREFVAVGRSDLRAAPVIERGYGFIHRPLGMVLTGFIVPATPERLGVRSHSIS